MAASSPSSGLSAASLPPAEEAALWEAARGGRAEARARLIETYLPFARMLTAKLFAARIDHDLGFDDYLQYGSVGLIEAVDRYEPGFAVLFKTFATHRIQGAILGGIEHMSEKREQISVRQRLLSERRDSAKAALVDNAADLFAQLAQVAVGLALGYLLDHPDPEAREQTLVADNHYSGAEVRQLRAQMHALVERLPQRERMVIKYHYLNQMPFASIALDMELSKGRIAQIHRHGLDLLGQMMRSVRACDVAW